MNEYEVLMLLSQMHTMSATALVLGYLKDKGELADEVSEAVNSDLEACNELAKMMQKLLVEGEK